MSYPLEKPLGESLKPTSENCIDQTDLLKVEEMDDEDIVLTTDSPDTSRMDWSNAVFRAGHRTGTPAEFEEFKRVCLAYANRPHLG